LISKVNHGDSLYFPCFNRDHIAFSAEKPAVAVAGQATRRGRGSARIPPRRGLGNPLPAALPSGPRRHTGAPVRSVQRAVQFGS
jgi:hypothetical protein